MSLPGNVAAIGFDRRAMSPNQPDGLRLLSVFHDVPLRYHADRDLVAAKSNDLVEALVSSALNLESTFTPLLLFESSC